MIDVDGIKTYSNADALERLGQLASRVGTTRAIVEVGVYRGGSLRTIAQAAKTKHIVGVDTWGLEAAYASGSENPGKYGIDNMRIAEDATAGLDVTLVREYSVVAAADYTGPPIALLYIDGEHTYQACTEDYMAWSKHLTPTATVVFDDYRARTQCIVDAVDDLVGTRHLHAPEVVGDRLAVCKRVKPAP